MLEAEGKFLCKIIKSRVESRTDHKLDKFHFGFKNGRSTLQAIWGLREIIQGSRESREELVIVFIDLVKAFDSVDRETTIRSLRAFEVENALRCLVWQIHENAHGELDSKIKFKLERGVRQGCVIGPQIFSLIFDNVCKRSLAQKDHLAYADDLVTLAKSEQQAQSKLNKLSLEVEKAGMEISFPKTEVMTLNMGKACSVALQGKRLNEVTEFKYLGSINGQSDIEAAVKSNCTKARIAIVKMRPVLVSSTLTMRIKCRLIEMCLKLVTLHGLERATTREKDIDKMGAVLNKAGRMVGETCSKKTYTSEVLALKVPLRDIKIELAVRRAKLWLSLKKLKDDEFITRRRKTFSKDWMRALKLDLERLCVKDIEEWIRNSSKVEYSLNVNTQVKSGGTREQIVACVIGNCARHFATSKEMRRHLRNDHSESGEGLDMSPFQANEPTRAPMVCPATGCKMTYKQIRWWLDNMEKAHPQCTMVESDNVTEELTAEPQSTDLSGNTLRQQEDESGILVPAMTQGIYAHQKCSEPLLDQTQMVVHQELPDW